MLAIVHGALSQTRGGQLQYVYPSPRTHHYGAPLLFSVDKNSRASGSAACGVSEESVVLQLPSRRVSDTFELSLGLSAVEANLKRTTHFPDATYITTIASARVTNTSLGIASTRTTRSVIAHPMAAPRLTRAHDDDEPTVQQRHDITRSEAALVPRHHGAPLRRAPAHPRRQQRAPARPSRH